MWILALPRTVALAMGILPRLLQGAGGVASAQTGGAAGPEGMVDCLFK